VAILAGGRSRRMGAPKATLELAGRALALRAVDAAVAAGLDVAVVAPQGAVLPVLPRGVALWREPAGEPHPARGLVAALEACGGPVVALACDLPLVPPALLAWLAACEGTVVPSFRGVAQPLLARWEIGTLPALRAVVEGGGSLRTAAVAAGANSIDEGELRLFGEPEVFLSDVDTPAALARMEALLSGGWRIDPG
jgi:molybdopterin-guanine dinucleotide biosynthesis protein A